MSVGVALITGYGGRSASSSCALKMKRWIMKKYAPQICCRTPVVGSLQTCPGRCSRKAQPAHPCICSPCPSCRAAGANRQMLLQFGAASPPQTCIACSSRSSHAIADGRTTPIQPGAGRQSSTFFSSCRSSEIKAETIMLVRRLATSSSWAAAVASLKIANGIPPWRVDHL